MSYEFQESDRDEQQLLDLLADGELAEADRRQLLQRFESDPAGWRRCALALLEAQEWRRQVAAAARREPELQTSKSYEISPASRLPADRPWPRQYTWLAMAASFLAAFGLSMLSNPWQRTASVGAPRGIDSAAVATTTPAQRAVTLVMDDAAGHVVPVQVPLVEASPEQWNRWAAGLSANSPLPPEIQRLLEQGSHQVHQQRELLPVRLDDGRVGIVPVDRVEIQPVINRKFQ